MQKTSKTLNELDVISLKALLFDLDQRIKQEQNNYQQVGLELQKRIEEENNKEEKDVQPKSK